MALVLADRVKVRSFSVGTGDFSLDAPLSGFRDFSIIGNGNETYYGIVDASGNWEIGKGIYSSVSGVQSISRNVILSSSYNDLIVNFSSGAKNVFCTFPASAATGFSYNLSAESAVDGGIIRLAFSEGSVDDVKLTGSDGITVTRTDENTIDISAPAVTQSVEPSSDGAILRLDNGGTVDDIAVIGNTGVVVTRTDVNTITLTSDITQSAETTSGGAILRLDKTGITDDVSIIGDDGLVVTRTDANTITLTTDISQSIETSGFVGTSTYDDFELGTLDPLLWSQVQNVAIVTNGTGTGTGGFSTSDTGIYLVSGNIYDATSLGAVSSIDQLVGQSGYDDLPDFGYIKYTIAKSTGNQTIDVSYRKDFNGISQSAFSLLGSALTYGANNIQSILFYNNDDHDTLFLDANGNGVLARNNTDTWTGNFDSFKGTSVITANSSINSVVAYAPNSINTFQIFVSFPKTNSGVWMNFSSLTYRVNNFSSQNFNFSGFSGVQPRNTIFTVSDGVNQFLLGRWGSTTYFLITVDLTTGLFININEVVGTAASFQSNATEEDSNGTQLFAVDGTVTFHSATNLYYGGTRPWKNLITSVVNTSGKSAFSAGSRNTQTDMDIFGSIDADGYVWFADWGHDDGGLFNLGNDDRLNTRKTNIVMLDDSFASSSQSSSSTRYLLFGNAGAGLRKLTTTPIDLSGITAISFRYITGNSANGGELIDAGENLLLQLSLDGSNFDTVVTLPVSPAWITYTYTVDSQYRTLGVYVQFSQTNSGPSFDWIGLDTFQLTGNTALNSVIHRLSRSGAANDDITILGRSGIEITRNTNSSITLTAGISQSVETAAGGAIIRMEKTQGISDDITITGTNGVAVSRVDADTINIDSTEATGVSIVMGL